MSSVRVRHPALEAALLEHPRCGSSSSRTPIPRPSGRRRHLRRPPRSSARARRARGDPRVLERAGGGWPRFASTRASLARSRRGALAAARDRLGPLPRAHRDDRPPRRARGRRPVRADRARHRRRQCRALAPHPQGDARAVAGACAVFAVSEDLAARLEAVAGPARRAPARRQRRRRPGRVQRRRPRGRAPPRSAGTRTGRASLYVGNLVPRKNLARLLEAFAAARAEWGGGSLALVGDGPLAGRARGARTRARHRRRRALRRGGAARRRAALAARLRRRLPGLRARGLRPGGDRGAGLRPAGRRRARRARERGGERGRHGRAVRCAATSPASPRRSCAQRRSPRAKPRVRPPSRTRWLARRRGWSPCWRAAVERRQPSGAASSSRKSAIRRSSSPRKTSSASPAASDSASAFS